MSNCQWYLALKAQQWGRGGIELVSQITGMHVDAIRRGRAELKNDLAALWTAYACQETGGHALRKKRQALSLLWKR